LLWELAYWCNTSIWFIQMAFRILLEFVGSMSNPNYTVQSDMTNYTGMTNFVEH